tara:strand:- start:4667 stop:5536 length:870 start_codon:yes stop_codon:yes gene_type:complete
MNDFVSLINGKFSDKISVLDRGLSYGDGFFETMRWVSEKQKNVKFVGVEYWNRHITRIIKTSDALNLRIPPVQVFLEYKNKLIKKALSKGFKNGVIKIIITRGIGKRGYKYEKNIKPTIIFLAFSSQKPYHKKNYFSARFCQTNITTNKLLSGWKHLNRLDSVLARSEWDNPEIYEGILIDKRKNIMEGTMSNVFFVKNDILYTPKIYDCGINGIMREVIIEKAKNFYNSIKIVNIKKSEVKNFSEMFISNSLINLVFINQLENIKFKISKKTKKLYSYLNNFKNREII